MSRTPQRLRSLTERYSPYPLAVQVVATLALLATPLSALGQAVAPGESWRRLTLTGIAGVLLLALFLVPARRLPLWGQLLYLVVQLALATAAQAIAAAPLLDYVYLSIVLQALALFRSWLWIPFAVGVWTVWSGAVLSTASLWPWLQSNLALAFPATCAIIAAVIYTRQLRRGEQAQQMLQQMQQRYDSLASALRDLQQRVAQEERRRITDALAGEVQAAIARTEQGVAAAMGQAQTNLARLQLSVAQTRDGASAAIERLRHAVATLRRGEPPPPPPSVAGAVTSIGHDEQVIGATATRVFTWVLPSVFLLLSLSLTIVQRRLTPDLAAPLVALGALLMLTYVCTQQVRHPVLLQAGLAGQTVAVVSMTALTNTLPLLLGLLLVLWQVATRLSASQVLVFLLSVPASAGLLLTRIGPLALDHGSLLATTVAAAAVAAPLVLARRQHSRRRQAELRLVLLAGEIEQQTSEVRALAVAAERARLAREFHDDLGSRLVLINLQMQMAEELAAEDPAAALEQLRGSREQLHEAWRGLLALADAELTLDGPQLGPALARLAEQCRACSPARVELRVEGPLDELPPAVAHCVYRAAQEGLTNASKHARARLIDIHIISESHYVTVTVLNDDQPGGERPALGLLSGSLGLLGLRERAEALGGGVEAGPTAEGGWRLRLVLPAESA